MASRHARCLAAIRRRPPVQFQVSIQVQVPFVRPVVSGVLSSAGSVSMAAGRLRRNTKDWKRSRFGSKPRASPRKVRSSCRTRGQEPFMMRELPPTCYLLPATSTLITGCLLLVLVVGKGAEPKHKHSGSIHHHAAPARAWMPDVTGGLVRATKTAWFGMGAATAT